MRNGNYGGFGVWRFYWVS